MPNLLNHYSNLIGQTCLDTHVQSSLALRSTNSQGVTQITNHGDVDVLLSVYNFPTQTSAFPMSGQLWFRQHGSELGFGRSNHGFPTHVMQPHNTLNINIANIVMGNNSSLNINLLNNNLSSQFARTHMFTTSSSNTPVQKNVISSPSSNFNPNFLPPEPKPQTNSVQETNERPQFTTSYSQYSSSNSSRVANHDIEILVDIPCLRQNAVSSFSSPAQNVHCQDHLISQSSSDFSSLRLQSRYFSLENHNDFSALPSLTMHHSEEQILEFEGGNDNFNEDELLPQKNLQTPDTRLELTRNQALSQVPFQNDNMTEAQHAQRRQHCSSVRCNNHPYVKYGPYNCPKCSLSFQNGNSYAAHVKKHYKDESTKERKKRREAKFRSRNLHIAQSTSGITVMPGSYHMEEMSQVTSLNQFEHQGGD